MKRISTSTIKMAPDVEPPSGRFAPGQKGGAGGEFAPGQKRDAGGEFAPGQKRDAGGEFAPGQKADADGEFVPGRENETEPDFASIPIEDALDLHFIAPRDVPIVVEEYLWEASAAGFAEVRIIHGKGIGVQRRRVAGVLEKHPVVISYQLAAADRGHYGATIARLRTDIERPPDQGD